MIDDRYKEFLRVDYSYEMNDKPEENDFSRVSKLEYCK